MDEDENECLWWVSIGSLHEPPEICGFPLQDGQDLCPKHAEMSAVDRTD